MIDFHIEVYYFDADDFDNPVKSKTISNLGVFHPSETSHLEREVFFNRNEYILNDNYMDIFGEGETGSFIGEGKTINTFRSIDDANTIITYRMYLDNVTIHYQRDVVNILEVLGNIGGLYQILIISIYYVFEFISDKLLYFRIKTKLNSSHQSSNDDNKRKVRHYSQVECQEDSKDDEQIENFDTPFFERYVEKFNLGDVYWTAILDKSANESNSKTKSEKKFK